MERNTPDEGVGRNRGGTREGDEMDPLDATGTASRTPKGRKERDAAIQGAGEAFRYVETMRHGGAREGMEADSSGSGEEIEPGGI
jgi:hypothetical protein